MKILKNEKGFIVSVTAIIVSIILGIVVLYFSNSITTNVTSSANNYSSSQARWAAIAGMEHTLLRLHVGLEDIAGVYPFYNSNIVVDTMTINPAVDSTMRIISRGTHSSSTRIFAITISPLPTDILIDEGFEDDDGFDYDPGGVGPGPRYWGLTCGGEIPNLDILPTWVLTGLEDDDCFFFGTKVQNNSNLVFEPIETSGGNYELKLTLAVGVDKQNPDLQSDFQTGDFLEFTINDILIERWEGLSEGGGDPMYPTVGNATDSDGIVTGVLTPDFRDYYFNLSEILGPLETIQLNIEGKTNRSNKYIGIAGISLIGLGGWAVDTGSYIEI